MGWSEKYGFDAPAETNAEAATRRQREAIQGANERVAALEARVSALGPQAHTLIDERECACGWRSGTWGGREAALRHVLEASGALDEEKAAEAAQRAEAERIERERWETLAQERARDAARAKVRDSGHPYPQNDVPPGGVYQCACGARVEVPAASNKWAAHADHLDALITQ